MARTSIEFEYDGKEYTLCYNLATVKALDRAGKLANIKNSPLTATLDLFVAAFEAKHPTVPNNRREEIFRSLSDSSEDGSLLETLLGMINEATEALTPKGETKWRTKTE